MASINDLSPSLRAVLDYELANGNVVVEESAGWVEMRLLVILRSRFRMTPKRAPSNLQYRLISDPHYWYAEFEDSEHKQLLDCGYK